MYCKAKKNFGAIRRKKILFLKKKVVSLKKTSFSFFSKVQWQIIFLFNVLALQNILVALTREVGDGPCFLYWKLFWVGVFSELLQKSTSKIFVCLQCLRYIALKKRAQAKQGRFQVNPLVSDPITALSMTSLVKWCWELP